VETEDISVSVGGRLWQLKRAGNLEDLWENMLNDPHDFEDERLPYWTELWPSGVALARWLATRKKQIANQRCLDLGCGLGFAALVGQWLGALIVRRILRTLKQGKNPGCGCGCEECRKNST
jgi:predicted nicotinamide N-methyase